MSRRAARPTLLLATIGAGLILVATGFIVLAVSLPVPGAHLRAGNAAINAGAPNALDISANNSPTLVRNPTNASNLVVANRVDSPLFSCVLSLSFDAGASWQPGAIPFPSGEEAPPRCFAPDAAFGVDGRLYITFATLIGLGNSPNAIWLISSTDGGRSFDTPRRLLGPLAFQVRLITDPSSPRRLSLSWLQAGATGFLSLPSLGNNLMFSHSDDGGDTWTDPATINPPSRLRVVAAVPAVAGDGQLICAYLDLGNDRLDYEGAHAGRGGPPYNGAWHLVVARSVDGGRTWHDTVVEPDLVPITRFIVYLPIFPSIAVDRQRGRVYVAYHSARLGDADVYVWTSDDGGAHFSAGVRVNDTPRHDGTSQYLPALALAPNGRLDVMYFDRRADRRNIANTVSLQSSSDAGRTFGPRTQISDHSFDSRIGFGSDYALADLGSRLALLATDRADLAVWTDTRAGRVSTPQLSGFDKQDIARAFVAIDTGSGLRSPLLIVGLVLLAGGALTVLWSVVAAVSGRRRQSPAATIDQPVPDAARADRAARAADDPVTA